MDPLDSFSVGLLESPVVSFTFVFMTQLPRRLRGHQQLQDTDIQSVMLTKANVEGTSECARLFRHRHLPQSRSSSGAPDESYSFARSELLPACSVAFVSSERPAAVSDRVTCRAKEIENQRAGQRRGVGLSLTIANATKARGYARWLSLTASARCCLARLSLSGRSKLAKHSPKRQWNTALFGSINTNSS